MLSTKISAIKLNSVPVLSDVETCDSIFDWICPQTKVYEVSKFYIFPTILSEEIWIFFMKSFICGFEELYRFFGFRTTLLDVYSFLPFA